ncbi:MAG: hypothetical protein NZ108_03215 [Bacteroidia bacterium]|nr:hypothetical protein [Bacteroidia bacterium]
MKLPVIKKLAETKTIAELQQAEEAILADTEVPFLIEGDDRGEQLTHVLSAIEVLQAVEKGESLASAIREFAKRVRTQLGQE